MSPRAETDDPWARALGRAVRGIRKERNLTQDSLGLRADIHPTWLSHIEAGRVNPTFLHLVRVSNGLGIKPSELIGRVEEEMQ
jgi:transcriptional regulator with XRE-family HTH domain